MSAFASHPTNSAIVAAYRQRTPCSAALNAAALDFLPNGITHDGRYVDPYSIHVDHAAGAHKWDVDGNRYIDYFGGHGALLLGHRHPAIVAAVTDALEEGTHFGASHPREIDWARAIRRLVPSAERMRFTNSGTEATLMALRLARAYTGRSSIARFKGHFHGWHDHATTGFTSHFDGTPTAGVIREIPQKVHLVTPGDIEGARSAFDADPDIAAVILEPTGASFGLVPIRPEFVQELRDLTERKGALLIFDEVVTGFRTSSGGAQRALGITPDLSAFAKIVAGGLPGGVVAGRRDILDMLDFKAAPAVGKEKIDHPGTFNANPLSAAAGTACLAVLAESNVNEVASTLAQELRQGLNEVLARTGLKWAVYGETSGFHLFTNAAGREITPLAFDPYVLSREELTTPFDRVGAGRLRLAMLLAGIDLNPRLGGMLSAAHTSSEVEATIAAFGEALAMARAESLLPR